MKTNINENQNPFEVYRNNSDQVQKNQSTNSKIKIYLHLNISKLINFT